MSGGFEEVVRVERDDSGLVGLGHVGENAVHHADQHSVLPGVARVLNNGHDVGALFSDVEQVAAGPVRKFDGVNEALGSDNVRNVGDRSSGGSTEVEDLLNSIKISVKTFILH